MRYPRMPRAQLTKAFFRLPARSVGSLKLLETSVTLKATSSGSCISLFIIVPLPSHQFRKRLRLGCIELQSAQENQERKNHRYDRDIRRPVLPYRHVFGSDEHMTGILHDLRRGIQQQLQPGDELAGVRDHKRYRIDDRRGVETRLHHDFPNRTEVTEIHVRRSQKK